MAASDLDYVLLFDPSVMYRDVVALQRRQPSLGGTGAIPAARRSMLARACVRPNTIRDALLRSTASKQPEDTGTVGLSRTTGSTSLIAG
ncbi:MAG: hypothetical protein ACOH2F_09880 [Cellulomonas sp.]